MAEPSDQTVLLHVAYPLRRKIVQLAFARAKQLKDQGTGVLLSYCNAPRGTCAVNFAGNPAVCRVCQSRIRKMAKQHDLPIVGVYRPENASQTDASPIAMESSSRESIAEGVQSAITTMFRVLPSDAPTHSLIESIRKRYQYTSERVLQGLMNVIKTTPVSRVEVFNGRHACSRVAVLAAKTAQLPFNTLELSSRLRPILFRNHVAHDRHAIQNRMRSHPADMQHAEQFFTARQSPRVNRYAKRHAPRFTPPSHDGFERKVSIFLSSQDEFEALGQDWESPFRDTAKVILAFCERYPDTLFCIRFHPNQAEISSDIRSPFASLKDLPNARVFYPEDTVNSYELIQWSDVVVTFGSTVTIEACWMGKPVVLLGPSFFDELEVAYTPQTAQEALEIFASPLSPKPRENAARAAHYMAFAGDDLAYVESESGFSTPKIPLARPIAGAIARVLEDCWCHWIKKRINPASKQPAA